MTIKDKILGTLYGQAIGDAMGMPSELWPVEKIRQQFNGQITTFLDGPANNDIAVNFTKGEYTDDTNQALAILDSLIETGWQPDQQNLVQHIMRWADQVGAWENNILGPSSKAALTAIKHGEDPRPITDKALTNGAGMRISPIGALFDPQELSALIKMVYDVTRVTHSSDVAMSGATMVAGAVAAAVADYSWDEIIDFALNCNDQGFKMGAPTWAAKTHERLKIGIALADRYRTDVHRFSQAIYDVIGTGTMISESIPAAVAIAYYAKTVRKSALLCANLGGDTDTIGAMATAICGAKNGASSIDQSWIDLIDTKNPQHHFEDYAEQMLQFRSTKK
ncbi:ADP-ribosylglycohydrolase [Secundilactobacillus pentosiphilus]|uniref:ADP-ribosylglycohydrolase n=1 Tax=Secundilactobacillus pentosiphilus TaxID=1714682 RepID=A0A1Z5ILL5_9LACO|nr:ADP-ribosylglycohydrolase family protein [Secundilactobacillus pentosiphilus]GAX02655.1 ADP-ribosylglycohydrolase [Secundilactobacillus pentosiphilus]